MNRADIRQAVFDQIDWQPDTSSDYKNKLNRFINRAYQQLVLDVPFLFFEDKAHFRTQIDISANTGITNDGVTQVTSSINTSGLVWSRSYIINGGVPGGVDASIVEWDLDPFTYVTKEVPHPWDGRWVEITDSTGRVHRRRIRRLWYTEDTQVGLGTHIDYFSLDKPLDLREFASVSSEYTQLDYRIYTHSYYLPSDTIEVRSLRIWSEERREPISLIYTGEAEDQWWDDIQGTSSSGTPRKAFRTDYFQLPSPVLKPEVETRKSLSSWDDKYSQPQGTFEFFYTICWGALDRARVVTSNLSDVSEHRRPRWESAPSPLSGQVVLSSPVEDIRITLPNIGAPYGFAPDDGEIEDGKSGYWKRIYARRVVSDRTATSTQAIVGDPEDYFLVGWQKGSSTNFTFNGNLINFDEPWRDIHGYSGLQLSPLPDKAYDVDIRYLRKPHPLNTDQAVPRIPPEAIEVLVQKTVVLVYESLSNHELLPLSMQKYERMLVTISKRYGSLPSGVFRKRLGRAEGRGRRGHRFLIEER